MDVLLFGLPLTAILTIMAHRIEAHAIEHIDRQTKHLERQIAMSAQDTINAAVATIKHGTSEVLAKIAELQAKVDAGVPSEELDLSELTAAAQALEDVVPDLAPVDEALAEPVDEPVDG